MPSEFRIAAAPAFAVIAILAIGSPLSAASAAPGGPSVEDDHGALVNVSDNNVGPVQVCNNDVPVNVGGLQVPVSELAAVGGLGGDGDTGAVTKGCGQASQQDNDDAADDSEGPDLGGRPDIGVPPM